MTSRRFVAPPAGWRRAAHRWGTPLALAVAWASGASAQRANFTSSTASAWESAAAICARVTPPKFAAREFAIDEYGAVAGGEDCRAACERAIAACRAAGGGRVVVPPGAWRVGGPIRLRSDVELHLTDGARLEFVADPGRYLPATFTRFEGVELMNYSPLIYACDERNVGVTGRGVLDGQASPENWWAWHGDPAGHIKQLGDMAERGVPPSERSFGAESRLRPNFIQFYRCANVLIADLRIERSPMWAVHPVLCRNVTVRNVAVNSHGPNNDGCNPESCRDVVVEGCTFDTGDDCIAIKSGRNADGRRLAAPSENIVVRRCTMLDGHGGVTLGSEMSGGVRNVFVDDCTMSSPRLDYAIRLKSNSRRGGFLENLYVRNLRVGETRDALLHVNLRYFDETGVHNPVVRGVFLENIECARTRRAWVLRGLGDAPIQRVELVNCTFQHAGEPSVIEHVSDLLLREVFLPEPKR